MPIKDLADRAQAYGIQSYIVDGNDVVAVYETTRKAVEQCRAGDGPVIIESKTMRMRGHAQHDPAEYVPKEMFAYWKQRDPLELYEKYLDENKLWDAKTRKEIEARIDREVDARIWKLPRARHFLLRNWPSRVFIATAATPLKRFGSGRRSEVMPPKSSVEPVWKMVDSGGMASGESLVGRQRKQGSAQGNAIATTGGEEEFGGRPRAKS